MTFELTEEQKMIQELARDLAQKKSHHWRTTWIKTPASLLKT
jgi:hypothetical protein